MAAPDPPDEAPGDDEVFTWTPSEARAVARSQSGASNCGATALLNVLAALKLARLPDASDAEHAVHTNARRYGVSVSAYLAARSVAGCTAEDIVRGCGVVAAGEVSEEQNSVITAGGDSGGERSERTKDSGAVRGAS